MNSYLNIQILLEYLNIQIGITYLKNKILLRVDDAREASTDAVRELPSRPGGRRRQLVEIVVIA